MTNERKAIALIIVSASLFVARAAAASIPREVDRCSQSNISPRCQHVRDTNRGVLRVYHDEAGKETRYDTDDLGRVTVVRYLDNSSEQLIYENQTGAIAACKDRKGQWFSYFYDNGGRLSDVRLGGPRDVSPSTAPAGTPYLKYIYDLGGRLRTVASADAATEYDDYDLLGRPGTTRQIRYRDHSGLTGAPAISDVHTQKHVWTIFEGERERWRMPAAGMTVPDVEPASQWRSWIVETRDGAGNITHQQIATGATSAAGASITRASGRGIGRLSGRTRFFGIAGNAVEQTYGYADGLGAASSTPGPASGLLDRSTIAIGSFVLAGSEISRDAARREEMTKDLGLTARQTSFGYDDRGRLASSSLLGESSASVTDTLVHADFRHDRTVSTDARDLAELGSMASQVAVPTWAATQTDLHQYDQRTVASESAPRTYTYDAGRRTSDGFWSSEYDVEGRLAAIQRGTERIEFTYGPSGRLVGRQALKRDGTAWVTEDRQTILDRDGLPADSTFVWDPIADRLLAIFEARQSIGSAPAPDAGLIRQYLHGDQGYDDPVEVSAKRADGTVARYLPIIDEAGSGSVHAVVAPSGLLAERVVYADAYGDAPRYLQGPVVDKIEVEPTKAADGSVSAVTIRVRLSEMVDTTSISSGLRVSAVDRNNAVLNTTSGQITASGNTVSMTVTGSAWTALTATSGATQIEIAVSNTLRAAVWDGPVMPTPSWLLQNPSRGSTPQFPVIQRESFASLIAFVATLQTGESRPETLLQIHDLYLAASSTSVTKLFTGFKAAPFVEPRTGFAYFRARWYSPSDGHWLTPDPLGTEDSSNLYAYCADDPINCGDPMGKFGEGPIGQYALGVLAEKYVADPQFASDADAALDVTMQVVNSPAFQGTMQVVGGCGEAATGAYAVAQTGGLAAVPGWIAVAHGSDVCGAGVRTLLTGQVQESFTKQGAQAALIAAHVDPEVADVASSYFDVGVSVYGTVGSSRLLLGVASGRAVIGEPRSAGVDTDLAERLTAYKAWKSRAGIKGTPTSGQFRRFVGAHRPASLAPLYEANTSRFASWMQSMERDTQTYYLYQKVTDSGEHLKFGITYDLYGRYTPAELNGGSLRQLAHGPKTEMLRLGIAQ